MIAGRFRNIGCGPQLGRTEQSACIASFLGSGFSLAFTPYGVLVVISFHLADAIQGTAPPCSSKFYSRTPREDHQSVPKLQRSLFASGLSKLPHMPVLQVTVRGLGGWGYLVYYVVIKGR